VELARILERGKSFVYTRETVAVSAPKLWKLVLTTSTNLALTAVEGLSVGRNQFGVLGQITTVIKSHHTWGLRTITRKFLGMVRTKEMSRKCLRKLGKGVYTSRFEDVLFEDRFLE
jgi:hypothetical protein